MNRQKLQLSAASMAIIMTCSGCISGKPRPWSSANCSQPHPIACDDTLALAENREIQTGLGDQHHTIRLASNESNYRVKDPIQPAAQPNSILVLKNDSLKTESLLQSKLSENSSIKISVDTSSRRSGASTLSTIESDVNDHDLGTTSPAETAISAIPSVSHLSGTLDFEESNPKPKIAEAQVATNSNDLSEDLTRGPSLLWQQKKSSSIETVPGGEQRGALNDRHELQGFQEHPFNNKILTPQIAEQNICQGSKSVELIDNRVNWELNASSSAFAVSQKNEVVVSQEKEMAETDGQNQIFDATPIGSPNQPNAIAAHPPLFREATVFSADEKTTGLVDSSAQYHTQLNTPETEVGLPVLPLRMVDRGWMVEKKGDPAIRALQIADSHRTTAVTLLESKPRLVDNSQYASDRNWISADPGNQVGDLHRVQTPARMASSRRFNATSPSTDINSAVELMAKAENGSREFHGYEYDRPDFSQPAGDLNGQPALYLDARPNHQPVWIPPVLNMTESQTVVTDSNYITPPTVDQPKFWQPPAPIDSQEKWIPPRTPTRLQDFSNPIQLDRYTDRPILKQSQPILER